MMFYVSFMIGFVVLEEVVLRLRVELRNLMEDYKRFLGHSSWEVILCPNVQIQNQNLSP